MADRTEPKSDSSRPQVVVIESQEVHDLTFLMLHGLGSTGEGFLKEFFDSEPTNGDLRKRFPGARWVFPTALATYDENWKEFMTGWFEARSLTDPNLHQELAISGIIESTRYLNSIIDQEIQKLGNSERLVVFGISQGAATAMWTLLSRKDQDRPLGALVCASAWLPFASTLQKILQKEHNDNGKSATESKVLEFVSTSAPSIARAADGSVTKLLEGTPILLGHGIDDQTIDLDLGKQVFETLSLLGAYPIWKKYEGAEAEGHWLKEPEQFDDIAEFVKDFVLADDRPTG